MRSLLSVLLVASCSTPPVVSPPPPAQKGAAVAMPAHGERRPDRPTGPGAVEVGLTLERALDLAFSEHPALVRARAEVDVAAARLEQAGRWTNPDLVAGFENAPIDGGTFQQAEYLLGVAQSVPLSGRHARERDVGARERQLAEEEASAQLFEVRRAVHGAFATALYAQAVAELVGELARVAEQSLGLARVRLEAGDAVADEVARMRLEHGLAQREARRAETTWRIASGDLVAAIGAPARTIDSVAGDLDLALALPALEELVQRLDENPAILVAAARADVAAAQVDLAQALRVPELRLELLYRRDEATEINAFDAFVGVPLNLWSSGRLYVKEKRRALTAARADELAQRNALAGHLRRAHLELERAIEDLQHLRSEILPRVEELLALSSARHELGDILLDELLQARRELLKKRLEECALQREALRAFAELTPYLEFDGPG